MDRIQLTHPLVSAPAKLWTHPTLGKKTESCAGKYRMALAKMMGMTPAVLTLMGR